MTILLAVAVGALYAGGLYMMLRRGLVKLIIGLALLSHAANLLIFTAGGLNRSRAPLVPPQGALDFQQVSDPLPQALILTAIVISFGVLAFALALLHRTFGLLDLDDLDKLKTGDE